MKVVFPCVKSSEVIEGRQLLAEEGEGKVK